MTSLSYNLNPRANVFILVNLGCEMLFVIDQRLKAQQIALDKSIQVIHDVIAVLLEPKFIDSLIVGSTQPNAQLLTEEHCKFMLKDIATCSLMRLDDISMELWNLMTMIYKWQLFESKKQYHLMDITFRHLQAIGNFYPDEKRSMLIDFTKNTLLDFWNSCSDVDQHTIYRTNIAWLELFNTKISLLIRLGFQALDGTFFENEDAMYYQDLKYCLGDNIYIKSVEIEQLKLQHLNENPLSSAKCVNQLAEMLNLSQNSTLKESVSSTDDIEPINVKDFQKKFEQNLQQCNILFQDLDVNEVNYCNISSSTAQKTTGFVHLNPVYNRNLDINNTTTASLTICSQTNALLPLATPQCSNTVLNKDLTDFYNKIN